MSQALPNRICITSLHLSLFPGIEPTKKCSRVLTVENIIYTVKCVKKYANTTFLVIFGACGALSLLPSRFSPFLSLYFCFFPPFPLWGLNFPQKSLMGGISRTPPPHPRGGSPKFGNRKSPKIWLYGTSNSFSYPRMIRKMRLFLRLQMY